ncbi:hypothetical protein PPGU16_33990 [Paraburkholderia largidicola]|jgi:hypothetical protein|uniref:Uncharacterized protein n=1 Tax=Paraburkholderia largidicola TaxID=3014751 RepID=A0A7I8BNY1_9BURK|nr:hypothetical protein PPGU16_33990 [Paraburkholderia sp. PGU16]
MHYFGYCDRVCDDVASVSTDIIYSRIRGFRRVSGPADFECIWNHGIEKEADKAYSDGGIRRRVGKLADI